MQVTRTEAFDQPVDEGQVHAADKVAVLGGQLMERAVTQPDGAIRSPPRLEAVLAQGRLDPSTGGLGGRRRLIAGRQACTVSLGRSTHRHAALSTGIGLHGNCQQSGGELILARGHCHGELVPGAGVELRWPAGPGPVLSPRRWYVAVSRPSSTSLSR